MTVKINSQQSRKINALIRRLCCNCVNGNCLLLDDGEEHSGVQLISKYGVYCNYFKNAVLSANKELFADVMKTRNEKHCQICGKAFFRNLKIKDITPNVPKFKSVKKQPSANGKNECLRHAFKVWYSACYKEFQELNTARSYLNILALNFKVNKHDKVERRLSFE